MKRWLHFLSKGAFSVFAVDCFLCAAAAGTFWVRSHHQADHALYNGTYARLECVCDQGSLFVTCCRRRDAYWQQGRWKFFSTIGSPAIDSFEQEHPGRPMEVRAELKPGERWHKVRIDLWVVCLLFMTPVARWLVLLPNYFRQRRHRAGLCAQCGYDLRATPKRCPECGVEAGRVLNRRRTWVSTAFVLVVLLPVGLLAWWIMPSGKSPPLPGFYFGYVQHFIGWEPAVGRDVDRMRVMDPWGSESFRTLWRDQPDESRDKEFSADRLVMFARGHSDNADIGGRHFDVLIKNRSKSDGGPRREAWGSLDARRLFQPVVLVEVRCESHPHWALAVGIADEGATITWPPHYVRYGAKSPGSGDLVLMPIFWTDDDEPAAAEILNSGEPIEVRSVESGVPQPTPATLPAVPSDGT